MKKILILILGIFISPLAMGGQNGGGAGGLEINGKVYTLSNLGLKPADSDEPYFLDPETVDATVIILTKLDDILPNETKGLFRKAISDSKHTYQRLSIVDPKLYEAVKKEYQKYIDSLQVKGKFILGAFTDSNGVTSLFPDFDRASPQDRAIWIVSHETVFFLRPNATLKQVLAFESALHAFALNTNDKDTWTPVQKSLAGLGLLYRLNVMRNLDRSGSTDDDIRILNTMYVRTLEQKGVKLKLADIVPPNTPVSFDKYYVTIDALNYYTPLPIDAMTLSQNSSIDKYFSRQFYRMAIYTGRRGDGGFVKGKDCDREEYRHVISASSVRLKYDEDVNADRPLISLWTELNNGYVGCRFSVIEIGPNH